MTEKTVFTPWEVEGVVDYEKLLKEFGAYRVTDELLTKLKKHTGELHILLSRKVFYAHRDLDLVLKDYAEGKGFFLYTGIAPSRSTMHLAHIVPFVMTQWLQEKFKVNMVRRTIAKYRKQLNIAGSSERKKLYRLGL